jgi:hypothetical protein
MAKKTNQEPPPEETADDSATTPPEWTPAMETPEAETPPPEETAKESGFICPACKHTTGIKIGAPYQKNGQTLQYVKCAKCNHMGVDVL